MQSTATQSTAYKIYDTTEHYTRELTNPRQQFMQKQLNYSETWLMCKRVTREVFNLMQILRLCGQAS